MTESLPPSSRNLESASVMAELLYEHGYKETDMQYNIGRIEGAPRRGFDLIHPELRKRLYVTEAGSESSEKLIKGILGPHAVLDRVDSDNEDDGVVIYQVPRGTRLMHKTLRSGPYERPYMRSLAARTYAFFRQVAEIDSNSLGVSPQDVAITFNGSESGDDIALTLVPPLSEPINPLLEEMGVERFIRREISKRRIGALLLSKAIERPELFISETEALFKSSGKKQIEKPMEKFDLSLIMKYLKTERDQQ